MNHDPNEKTAGFGSGFSVYQTPGSEQRALRSELDGYDFLEGEFISWLDLGRGDSGGRIRKGFYAIEEDHHRWMSREAELSLNLPDSAGYFFLEGYAPPPVFTAGPLEIGVFSGGMLLGRLSIPEAGGFSRRLRVFPEVMSRSCGGRVDIRLVSSKTFVPRELDPASPDSRVLSVVAMRVGFGKLAGDELQLAERQGTGAGIPAAQGFHPSFFGICPLCGTEGRFQLEQPDSPRESMPCPSCGGINRWRMLARGLLLYLRGRGFSARTIPELAAELPRRGLVVYDTYSMYALARELKSAGASFLTSEFYPDIAPGTELSPNHFCQDLSRLTFASESLDVVLTTDVFEHVRLHREAFRECFRVLRPEGALIFTVPHDMQQPRNQVYVEIVDPNDPTKDRDLLPRTFHGDPLGTGGALVYRIYGRELLSELEQAGFLVSYEQTTVPHLGIYKAEVFTAVKPAAGCRPIAVSAPGSPLGRPWGHDFSAWAERHLDRDSLLDLKKRCLELIDQIDRIDTTPQERERLAAQVQAQLAEVEDHLRAS